jgi:hypothetical protein
MVGNVISEILFTIISPDPLGFARRSDPIDHTEFFNQEAADRGLVRNVEIRMLDDLLHSKSALIDVFRFTHQASAAFSR